MDTTPRRYQPTLWLLLLLLWTIVIWRAPLTKSLWLDETISYWISSSGFSGALSRSYTYQAESAAYFVFLAYWQQLFGSSEFMLRLPSVIAAIAASLVLVAIGRKLHSVEYGLIAALLLVGSDALLRAAFSARPYSFAFLAALLSVLALLTWLESGRRSAQIAYVFTTVAAIYLHYLFGAVILVHIAFLLAPPVSRRITSREYALTLFAAVLLLAPALPKLLHVLGREEQLSFAGTPSWGQLTAALVPPYVAVYLCCGAAMAFVQRQCKFEAARCFTRNTALPLVLWWAAAPIFFFAHARLAGESYFLTRLFLWQTGGLALLAALVLASFTPQRARLFAVLTLFVLCGAREASRLWRVEDWRAAAAAAGEAEAAGKPVLAYTGLIETAYIPWLEEPAHAPYLLAPFSYYQIPALPAPLPASFESDAARSYFDARVKPLLAAHRELLLIALQMRAGGDTKYRYVHQSLGDYFGSFGFEVEELPGGGLVKLFAMRQRTDSPP